MKALFEGDSNIFLKFRAESLYNMQTVQFVCVFIHWWCEYHEGHPRTGATRGRGRYVLRPCMRKTAQPALVAAARGMPGWLGHPRSEPEEIQGPVVSPRARQLDNPTRGRRGRQAACPAGAARGGVACDSEAGEGNETPHSEAEEAESMASSAPQHDNGSMPPPQPQPKHVQAHRGSE